MSNWQELQLTRPLEAGQAVVGVAQDGSRYAVCLVEGQVYVLENRCRHQGGPLGDGFLSDMTLTCPWHGWEYDIANGNCKHDYSLRPLAVYESRFDEGKVFIRNNEAAKGS